MDKMTSMERVLAALTHKKVDRLPLFLLLSLYGAKECGLTPKAYFDNPARVIATQIEMSKKYHNDCLYNFFYAAIEVEAFGGDALFVDDGPPNAGQPIIKSLEDIEDLQVPEIKTNPHLSKVLQVTEGLAREAEGKIPVIGVVMSPFSLPVMQMGFEAYLDLIYGDRSYFDSLMKVNMAFTTGWANAQLEAGATAITYFNPLASPTIIDKALYLKTGYPYDKAVLSGIKGPTATHLASGITLPVMSELMATGTSAIGFSAKEDLAALKEATTDKLCLIGNMNGIDMVNWSSERVDNEVRNFYEVFGKDGGFILSDNHGEIPYQVPSETLMAIASAVEKYSNNDH